MQYKDYYKILGVDKKADQTAVKAAYRKLARKYHPDVNKANDAQQKFKDINEAYEVLSDKEKRSRYDSLGSNWQNGSNFEPPPGYENMNFNFGGFGAGRSQSFSQGSMGDFSDFFSAIFGDIMGGQDQRASSSRTRQRAPQKEEPKVNLDMNETLALTLKEIVDGGEKVVTIRKIEKCPYCHGEHQCMNCASTGITTISKNLKVKIPKGVKEGQKIRLQGEGKTSPQGKAGDLYLIVKIVDPNYVICGSDLTKTIEISPFEAVLGAKKEVETPDGKINITIPPMTQSGKILRLKELGLPKTQGRGNLNLKLQINIPTSLSKEQKELYEKLKDLG